MVVPVIFIDHGKCWLRETSTSTHAVLCIVDGSCLVARTNPDVLGAEIDQTVDRLRHHVIDLANVLLRSCVVHGSLISLLITTIPLLGFLQLFW